MKQLRI